MIKVGSHSASEHRASKGSMVPAVQGRRGRPLDGVCGWAPQNPAGTSGGGGGGGGGAHSEANVVEEEEKEEKEEEEGLLEEEGGLIDVCKE